MKKICPRCGIIFEVASDPVFCTPKCKGIFNHPNFPGFKSSVNSKNSFGDSHTEIIRGKSLREKQEEKIQTEIQTQTEPIKPAEEKPLDQETIKPETNSKKSVHFEIIYAKKRN